MPAAQAEKTLPWPGSYRAAPPRSLAGSGLGPGGELACPVARPGSVESGLRAAANPTAPLPRPALSPLRLPPSARPLSTPGRAVPPPATTPRARAVSAASPPHSRPTTAQAPEVFRAGGGVRGCACAVAAFVAGGAL